MTTEGNWKKESTSSLRARPLLDKPFSKGWPHTHEYLDNIKLEGVGLDLQGVTGRSKGEQGQNTIYACVNLSRNEKIFLKRSLSPAYSSILHSRRLSETVFPQSAG